MGPTPIYISEDLIKSTSDLFYQVRKIAKQFHWSVKTENGQIVLRTMANTRAHKINCQGDLDIVVNDWIQMLGTQTRVLRNDDYIEGVAQANEGMMMEEEDEGIDHQATADWPEGNEPWGESNQQISPRPANQQTSLMPTPIQGFAMPNGTFVPLSTQADTPIFGPTSVQSTPSQGVRPNLGHFSQTTPVKEDLREKFRIIAPAYQQLTAMANNISTQSTQSPATVATAHLTSPATNVTQVRFRQTVPDYQTPSTSVATDPDQTIPLRLGFTKTQDPRQTVPLSSTETFKEPREMAIRNKLVNRPIQNLISQDQRDLAFGIPPLEAQSVSIYNRNKDMHSVIQELTPIRKSKRGQAKDTSTLSSPANPLTSTPVPVSSKTKGRTRGPNKTK